MMTFVYRSACYFFYGRNNYEGTSICSIADDVIVNGQPWQGHHGKGVQPGGHKEMSSILADQ